MCRYVTLVVCKFKDVLKCVLWKVCKFSRFSSLDVCLEVYNFGGM